MQLLTSTGRKRLKSKCILFFLKLGGGGGGGGGGDFFKISLKFHQGMMIAGVAACNLDKSLSRYVLNTSPV